MLSTVEVLVTIHSWQGTPTTNPYNDAELVPGTDGQIEPEEEHGVEQEGHNVEEGGHDDKQGGHNVEEERDVEEEYNEEEEPGGFSDEDEESDRESEASEGNAVDDGWDELYGL
ncbi:hypothetical protein FRC06_006782 [Ceratobasidium sp. 370]|nr:hypothetical protein FRC06_006782 [Ceratobasidium sp. 370]